MVNSFPDRHFFLNFLPLSFSNTLLVEDERLVTFGHGLIFNEAPEILPKEVHKKIKRRIASRILSTNKEKWWTVSAFYSECDEIRENEDKMFSFKTVDEKLKFLDGINEYVMNLEQKYSDA